MARHGWAALPAAFLLALSALAGARAQTPAAPAAGQKASPPYLQLKTIDLPGTSGGSGGAVAFDTDTDTVWLSQAVNRNLVVVDAATNTVRRVIEGVETASEIGFSEHYVFIPDAMNPAAVVIGKRSLEKAAALRPVGASPGAAYFDSKQGLLWVTAANGEMTVFKAVGRGGFKHLAGLRLKPGPPKETPGAGLYVLSKDRLYQPVDDVIDVINPKSLKLEHIWNTAAAGRIASLAYDPRTDRLVAGSEASLVLVVDAKSGKAVARLPIRGKAGAVSVDPGLRRAYVADAAGLVEVIDLDRNTIVTSFASEPGVRALAVDPTSHALYVYRARANKLDVYAPR
ncbi:MAG: YncE family protein [Alphaproteobacteria bacterium]